MRKLPIYLIALALVLSYAAVGGSAAAPYVSAVTGLMNSAASTAPAASATAPGTTAVATPSSRSTDTGTGPTGVPSPPAPTATGTGKPRPTAPRTTHVNVTNRLKTRAMVQRLVQSSKAPRKRVNFLILGSDNDQKFASYNAPLTQVMMVVSIDPNSHSVIMLSIPRDFWVHIPGYRYNTAPDGSGTVGWAKIDVASKLGFDAAACTVETNFGIPIDHWVWVGLKGFMRVIDTIHGVTLDVTYPVIDDNYPDDLANPKNPYAYRRIYIPPGPQHLNGDTALHFVRSRHGDAQGDFGRSSRQQILITQLRRFVNTQDPADLLSLLPALASDFSGEVKTDPGLRASPSTLAAYWNLMHAVSHTKASQVILSPPFSTPDYWVWDYDPQVVKENGGPANENAVQPNWPLINSEIRRMFGGQYFDAPHCRQVAGAGAPR